jgi:CheY-like chemotaxis protein
MSHEIRPPSAQTNSIAGAKVLLVEDNPVNLELGSRMLERLGCTVATADNGLKALECHAQEEFVAIFMDCQMPEMDGFEATAAIRARETETGKHSVIVALTGNALDGDREHCLAAGMDDYLPKPFTSAQIRSVLFTWIGSEKLLSPASKE